MTFVSDQLANVISQISDCVCTTVTAEGGGKLCYCGFIPGGTPAWDYCGECQGGACGMGYITVVSVFPYETFPDPVEFAKCDRPLAVTLKVGVLRCMPGLDESGSLPTEEDMWETGLGVLADMGAVYKALACCELSLFTVGDYLPLGADGGCVGGEWEVTVALDG